MGKVLLRIRPYKLNDSTRIFHSHPSTLSMRIQKQSALADNIYPK
jgi:hypothetical protein